MKVQSVYGPGPVSFAAKPRLDCCCAFVWTLDSGSKDSSSLKIVMDPGSWTLGPIWIVIVHAGRHQPAWHSRHLLSTLAAPGQSWAPEFYGPPPDFNDDSAATLRGIGSSLSLIIWT